MSNKRKLIDMDELDPASCWLDPRMLENINDSTILPIYRRTRPLLDLVNMMHGMFAGGIKQPIPEPAYAMLSTPGGDCGILHRFYEDQCVTTPVFNQPKDIYNAKIRPDWIIMDDIPPINNTWNVTDYPSEIEIPPSQWDIGCISEVASRFIFEKE